MANTAKANLNRSGIERWIGAAALLLFPLVMMQVGREWDWRVAAIATMVISTALLLIELVTRRFRDAPYRTGAMTALAASFLLTWVNLVAGITGREDNPANFPFFFVVLTAGVGAFATRAHSDGMARTMLGVAAVQAILTALTATDPATATDPRGVSGVLLLSGYFVALWLISAAAFWQAARHEPAPATG